MGLGHDSSIPRHIVREQETDLAPSLPRGAQILYKQNMSTPSLTAFKLPEKRFNTLPHLTLTNLDLRILLAQITCLERAHCATGRNISYSLILVPPPVPAVLFLLV